MVRDPWTGELFLRVVGKRTPRPIGQPPSADDMRRLASLAPPRTRAPKGVFVYRSHAEMDADRLAWTVEAVVARHRDG